MRAVPPHGGLKRPALARWCVAACLLIGPASAPALAQGISQKGFLETTVTWYPQSSPKETADLVNEYLLRYEASVKPAPWLRLTGSLDLRADTFKQTDYGWSLDWFDRGLKRSALGSRRLDVTISRGPYTLQIGKQNVRWGKTDILTPTDRFAPRDMLAVFDTDFLGVTAARFTAGLQSNTLDLVWVPVFTPSRLPLLDHRFAVMPPETRSAAIRDLGAQYPHGSQVGARWNHVGAGHEFSLSGFRGFNTLPQWDAQINFRESSVDLTRVYPRIWTAGADGAVSLSRLTLKGEVAYFGSADQRVDRYVQYVIQLERQAGEWFFVGGYAGEVVTAKRTTDRVSPDRGMAKAFLGRAGYTIDTNRSLAFDGAIRQNGKGSWTRIEFSQASGQHVRVTARVSWIRGRDDDFIGQFRRNSHATVTVRYSY
jgi:hypothetical protein